LWHYLRFLEYIFPEGFRGNGGWTLAWFPADLYAELLEALQALPFGEIQPILKPAKTGLHGEAYSLWLARLLAVEHVEFLVAKGFRKNAAEKRVADALGNSVAAVRSWRDTHLPKRIGRERVEQALQIARKAGEQAEALAAPEGYLLFNADVLAAYERHKELDLNALGRDMRQLQ
jgi:hypothetical protein